MTKTNNVIELNGKRYDAGTGAFLGSSPAINSMVRSLDGFVVAPTGAKLTHLPTRPAPSSHQTGHRSHPVKSLTAHQPQHSKTLMRHGLSAPTAKDLKPLRGAMPTDVTVAKPTVLSVKPKLSSEQIDATRSERALATPRSQQVARFQRHQPVSLNAQSARSTQPIRPTPAQINSQPTTRPVAPPRDIFEQAIVSATSHEQPTHKESRRQAARHGARRHLRAVSISAVALTVLLLGGFVAYQNKVALELQLASARAGFPASMPGYRPVGFAARSLRYSPGTVVIGYRDNNRSFNLTQKASNWDSETLLQNYVANANQPYQAYQAAGRTVYIYGNGNATWVSGGVWYQVSGNADLNAHQIIDLATSI